MYPPPEAKNFTQLPVLGKITDAYKLWQEFLPHFPKTSRYTLGVRIDNLFLNIIEIVFSAVSNGSINRLAKVKNSTLTLDSLKFLLQISWETKSLDTKKYVLISGKLVEIGKMLGGWLRHLSQKTSPIQLGEDK
ncbi:MAG: four helix bundle protein [Patescibacteria group bacterium]